MPRIRNWQDMHLFRPGAGHAYRHIDALFSGPIDWTLIAEHLPHMLRVALSIKAGRLLPSAILRRLGTYSARTGSTSPSASSAARSAPAFYFAISDRSISGARSAPPPTRASTSTAMRSGRGSGVAGS